MAEILASEEQQPLDVLRRAMAESDFSRVLIIEGAPAAVFGARVLPSGVAVPWALSTDVADRYPVAYWRSSKTVVGYLRGRYPVMRQCVDARYRRALRWAERLGFTVAPYPHLCGSARRPFHEIHMGLNDAD